MQNIASVHFYADGTKNVEGIYVNGKQSGKWVFYCTNGMPFKTFDFSDAVPNKSVFGIVGAYEVIAPWMKWEVELFTPK